MTLVREGRFYRSSVYSVFGEKLPSPENSKTVHDIFIGLAQRGELPAHLVRPVVVSPITGCWLPVGRYRGPGGYIVSGTTSLGLNRCGSSGGHRALVAVDGYLTELFPLPLTADDQVDHICRVTSCRCPGHLRVLDGTTNNKLKDAARTAELGLRAGQALLPALHPEWSEVFASTDRARVSSRYGAYDLRQVGGVVLPTALRCPVVSSLREAAPRTSRKRAQRVQDGATLFDEMEEM